MNGIINLTDEQYELIKRYRKDVCAESNPAMLMAQIIYRIGESAYMIVQPVNHKTVLELQRMFGVTEGLTYGDYLEGTK